MIINLCVQVAEWHFRIQRDYVGGIHILMSQGLLAGQESIVSLPNVLYLANKF